MSAESFGWGIIGLGEIAHTFARQLPLSEGGALAAVASRDLDRARSFAAQHAPGATAYGDYDQLLADPRVDAVYISTVHTEHATWTKRAAQAGKHVLCEKPLTTSFAETMAVHEAARAADVALLEAFMYRYHPQTTAFLDLVADGAVGEIQHVEALYSFAARRTDGRLFDPNVAGGGILDVGGYPASLAQAVAAARGVSIDPVDVRAGASFVSGVDGWSTASLRFADGMTAQISCGVAVASDPLVRVYGSEGTIELPRPWVLGADEPGSIVVRRVGAPVRHVSTDAAPAYAREADALVEASRTGADGESAVSAIALARLLSRWRAAIGLKYPFEADTVDIPTVDRRPLTRRSNEMSYARIAGVDKDISRLVLGCDNQRDLTFASVVFDDFFERGGNAFDTAYEYSGRLQEKLLGQWMTNRGIRDQVFVIGKGAHTPYCDPENLESQLLETLEDLQTDHLDLYFMHRDNLEIPVGEFVDVLDRYYRAGVIKAFGGSNWTRARFEEANRYAAANGKQGFTALSNHFGLAEALTLPWAGTQHVTDPESKRWLERTQTPLFPWASQARGFFSRARRDDVSDPQLVRGYYSEDNFERLARATTLAEERGVTPTAIALAFVLHQPFPTFGIIGPRTIEEIRTSVAAVSVELDADTVAWLDLRVDERHGDAEGAR